MRLTLSFMGCSRGISRIVGFRMKENTIVLGTGGAEKGAGYPLMNVVADSGRFFRAKAEFKPSSLVFDVVVTSPWSLITRAHSELLAGYAPEEATETKSTKGGGTYRPTPKNRRFGLVDPR